VNSTDGDELLRRRERWWRSAFLVVATTYVTLALAEFLLATVGAFAQILLILFVAWLLAFVLSPLVDWVTRRRGISRGVAVGLVYGAALLVSGFILFYAVSATSASIADWTADFPLTRARIEGTLHEWQNFIGFGKFQPDLIGLYRDMEATAIHIGQGVIGEVPAVSATVVGALVLVIVLSLYMVADGDEILERMARVVPNRYRGEFRILERSVGTAFGAFLRAQVLLAGVQAALSIAVVVVAGLPYGFLVVAVSSLAMLVPFFGPPLALVPPIVATLIFNPDLFLIVAPLLLIVQTLLVNWLQPRLMREALGMHPILVLVGILVGAQVAGVWGALFGIPVLAVLNVFFNYFVNVRTLEEAPQIEMTDAIEDVRREMPDATREELVAIAAERVEQAAADDDSAEAGGEVGHSA
jgi:predicted PurR-regulated permease PerM